MAPYTDPPFTGTKWRVHKVNDPPGVVRYEWYQNNPAPVQMMNVNDGFCFLSLMGGKFKGSGEGVWIYRDGDYWFLTGKSQQIDVAARARCIPYSSFGGARVSQYWDPYIIEGGKGSVLRELPGQTICYLTGISGKLYGMGEW
ncbi:MAG: hypothetical protein HC808_16285 [Candidatus Competibacteraceae bacterium]|nr:hypothetical protein [Candidatus Competibacteraceae bacterium]